MEEILGNETILSMYLSNHNPEPKIPSRGWSFNEGGLVTNTYDFFVKEWQKNRSRKDSIKVSSDKINRRLKPLIKEPYMYEEIGELDYIELYHGSHFIDKPQYDKHE